MANVLEELATISWAYKSFTPNELVKRVASFPMVVKTISSELGDLFYQDFSTDQVLYLHGVQEQFRFVAEDGQSNEISLPINTHINLLKVDIHKGKPQCDKMRLEKDMALPQIVKARCRHTNQEISDSFLTEEDYIVMKIKQRGVMKYIMGTCISTDGVSAYIECIPVNYSEISFKVALNMSDNQLAKFERRVQDVVLSIIPECEFSIYQGNPEIIINAQPNFIEIEEELTYTPQKASANYFKSLKKQPTKKNNPQVLISPRKEPQNYIPVTLKGKKIADYVNMKTSEVKNLGSSSSVEEPGYLKCINQPVTWHMKKLPPVPTKSGKTTLVSPTSNMRHISSQYENQNRHPTSAKPPIEMRNTIQKPKLIQKPVVMPKPSKADQVGSLPKVIRPSVPLKPQEKKAPPSSPQKPQIKAHKPSDIQQNHLPGTSKQSPKIDDDDELPTYPPFCGPNIDDKFDDDDDSDTDDDYDKIEFIEEVVNNRTDHQSTSTSPIGLPINESAKEVEVPQRNTKSTGKRHQFFTMPKHFKQNKHQSKQKTDASSTLPARLESQHKTTRQDDKIQGTEDLPDDLSTLTGRQVQDCLRLLKLEKYLEVFEDLGTDGCLLVAIDEDMMKNELHFTSIETLKLKKFITTKWLPS